MGGKRLNKSEKQTEDDHVLLGDSFGNGFNLA
jgi:hypothetical protein